MGDQVKLLWTVFTQTFFFIIIIVVIIIFPFPFNSLEEDFFLFFFFLALLVLLYSNTDVQLGPANLVASWTSFTILLLLLQVVMLAGQAWLQSLHYYIFSWKCFLIFFVCLYYVFAPSNIPWQEILKYKYYGIVIYKAEYEFAGFSLCYC